MLLYSDPELGPIAVTVNARARRFIFRCPNGQLACTAPAPYSERELRMAIDNLRPKLQGLLGRGTAKAKEKRFTPLTSFDNDSIHIRFELANVPSVSAQMRGDVITVRYSTVDILAEERSQQWIAQTLESFARKRVKALLVPRLLQLAEQRGLTVSSVKVTSARGRWGSCSSRGSINLSLYLAFLPHHLQDYVLHHELTHRLEMNHGPRFWQLLDQACGCNSHALRDELGRITLPGSLAM